MKDIISQLNSLKKIKPDANWQKSAREILLRQAESTASEGNPLNNSFIYFKELFSHEFFSLTKPAYSFALIFLLVVGGGFFSISAASEATPGSFMYTVKIVSEKTRLNLASNEADRVKLKVKFVQRRADEINNLVFSNEHAYIEAVAKNLVSDINEVSTQFSQIGVNNPQAALELAKDIDTKTNELRTSLKQARDALAVNSSVTARQLDAAIRSVDTTGLQVLSTLIAVTDQSVDQEAQQEISARVAAKIKTAKEQISDMENSVNVFFSAGLGRTDKGMQIYQQPQPVQQQDVKEKTSAATQTIAEAEQLLSENNYAEALDKINTSQQLLNEVEHAVETVAEVNSNEAEQTSTSTAAELIPQVKGVTETERAKTTNITE